MTLENRDPVPELCEMLEDRSLAGYRRVIAVRRLAEGRDPRAIPHLVHVIKTDDFSTLVYHAITVLGSFKSRAAVEGLIECFGVDFKDEGDWMFAFRPEMFRDHVAESLRKITGQSIGPDKQAWLAWWREKGKDDASLK